MKKKSLIFFTYLPPWRIDIFNAIAHQYDLKIVFTDVNAKGFVYNSAYLLSRLSAPSIFLKFGLKIKNKVFRLGILSTLVKHKPEIVFSHEYSPTSILLAILVKLKLFSYKLVITTSDNVDIAAHVSGLKCYFRGFVLSQSVGLIVYSEGVKTWYQAKFKHINIGVCPNIQNPHTLLENRDEKGKCAEGFMSRYSLNRPIVLYVGRLEKVKGLNLLVKAFAHSIVDTHDLVFVGEGKEKDYLMQLAETYGVRDNIIFAGYWDVPDLYSWYELADFLVLPSIYEPFGAVVNEALVFGCPVIASKYVGATIFIKEDSNGFIFDPLEEVEFVTILRKACEVFPRAKFGRKSIMLQSFEKYVNVFTEIIS